MNRPFGLLLLPLGLATVVGCQQGEKQNYANVSGTVTYNGQPIEKGQITFALAGRPPSAMDIVDGKFAGQAMVGSNKVSVSARRKAATAPRLSKEAETQIKGYREIRKGQDGDASGFDPTMVEYIPPEWGTESTQMRVVEAGVTNEFKLEITGPKH
ncbi:MAG TPA: hypothetical protein VKE74_19290 [Gemmataceae bacterium]|nr:hypothetical protein [Gemmataceae bacterium]